MAPSIKQWKIQSPPRSAAISFCSPAPVFSILEWTDQLGLLLGPHQLVTDVGSVKGAVSERAAPLLSGVGKAAFFPGHPMAGKEVHGAEQAEAMLFRGAVWLFTPLNSSSLPNELEIEWRDWVIKFGCRTLDLDAGASRRTLCLGQPSAPSSSRRQ